MRRQKNFEIQQAVNTICDAWFTVENVKSLLIKIRDMVPNNSSLRDVCDFIAHDEEKDSGVAVDAVTHFYLYLLFHLEFGNGKKAIDFYNMPSYIKDYLIMQLTFLDHLLKKELKKSKKDLKKIINDCVQVNKINPDKIDFQENHPDIRSILYFLLKTAQRKPFFTTEDIFKQVLTFLKGNKFIQNEKAFIENKEKFSLCVLLILHDKKLLLPKRWGKELESYLSSQYDVKQKEFYLKVVFIIKAPNHDNISILGSIMASDLKSSDWCDPSLQTSTFSGIKKEAHPDYKTFQPLKINEDFKLCAAFSEEPYDSSFHDHILYVDPAHGNNKAYGSI